LNVSRNNIIVLIVFMVIGVLGLGFLVYSSVNMLANTIFD